MATVTLSTNTIVRARELLTLYSKKSAFNLEEYSDVGSVYTRLTEFAGKEGDVEVSEVDVKYLVNVISVCSARVPTEVQNYKPIADLLETLAVSLKIPEDEVEEKSTVTEL
jgi:hypothetical protein